MIFHILKEIGSVYVASDLFSTHNMCMIYVKCVCERFDSTFL